MPFTVADVPTGINIGVWKSPCAVVKVSARALPLLASHVQSKSAMLVRASLDRRRVIAGRKVVHPRCKLGHR